MKIFGSSQVSGKFTATTGSFNKISQIPASVTPGFVIAGTDAGITSTSTENRSLIAQGLFDYVLASQDSGGTITQAVVPGGTVLGYRVQHLGNTVFSLTLNILKNNQEIDNALDFQIKTNINYSIDGGATMVPRYLFTDFYGFDMAWQLSTANQPLNTQTGYVVGCKLPVNNGQNYWPIKFTNLGRSLKIKNGSTPYPAVYITSDGGATFQELTLQGSLAASNYTSTGDCITAIAIDPTNEAKILYGTERGAIHLSTNAGITTTEVKPADGSVINRIVFAQGDSTVVYAVSGNNFGKIFISESGGTSGTWQQLNLTVNGVIQNYKGGIYDVLAPTATTVLFVGNEYGFVYKSTNKGTSWQKIPSGILPFNSPLISVKSVAKSSTTVALSENNAFVRNGSILIPSAVPNQFNTIQPLFISSPSATNRYICFDFATDPSDFSKPALMHVVKQISATEYDILIVNPSGNKILATSALTSTETPVSIFTRSSLESYVAATNGTIYKIVYNPTTNAITVTEETTSVSTKLLSLHGGLLGISPSQIPSASIFDNIFACGEDGTIIYKDYSSTTWTTVNVVSEEFENHTIRQIHAASNTDVYILTNDDSTGYSYVYKSVNTGTDWTVFSGVSLFGKQSRFVVAEYGANDIIAVLSENGSDISFTINNGSNWYAAEQTGIDFGVADIIFDEFNSSIAADKLSYVFAGTQGLALSINFNELKRIGPWDDTPIALVGITGETGYPYWIGGGTTTDVSIEYSEPYLLRSDNGGDSWQDISQTVTNPEPRPQGDFIITSLSEGKYIAKSNTDAFFIYKSQTGDQFSKINSNIFQLNREYINTALPDGIRKIHFVNDNVGYAISKIYNNQYMKTGAVQSKNQYQIIKTTNGGADWGTLTAPSGYEFYSIFFTSAQTGFVTAVSDNNNENVVFKTTDGGASWNKKFTLSSGPDYAPLDIYFILTDTNRSGLDGFIVLQGGSGNTARGVYRTTDGGDNWSFVQINGFGASNVGINHIQFINPGTGFLWGEDLSSAQPRIYKTTTTGSSWTQITAPSVSGYVVAGYFFDENRAVVGVSKYSPNEAPVLYTTANGGVDGWTLRKTVDPYTGKSIRFGHISQLNFSEDETLGIAVGFRIYGSETESDHFILKSTDKGVSWTEIDDTHTKVELQNFTNHPKQNWSRLNTVEFIEQKKINVTTDPPVDPPTTDSEICFESRFISASYYNYGNFAYKCSKPGETPQFVPNLSQNIGLGHNIFGQLTNINPSLLKLKLTYGAALGVSALGKAEYSSRDTAVGYGAMDRLRQAKENVAVGFKALSSNEFDGLTGTIIGSSPSVDNKIAISADGIYTSVQSCGVDSWQPLPVTASNFNQINTSSLFQYTQVLAVNDNLSYILANDYDVSGSASNTYILSLKFKQLLNTEYTSSAYTVEKLVISDDGILYGLDPTNGYVLKSANGGIGWATGSIQAFSGNVANNLKVLNETNGFLVGTYIWSIDTGSKLNWITSSYTGSYELNAIESIDDNTWVAVGTSGSIIKTTNSGTSWYRVTQSLTANVLNDIKNVINGNLVAAGISGSIIYSSDKGETWYTGSYATTESFSAYHYTVIDSALSGDVKISSEVGDVTAFSGATTWDKTLKNSVKTDNLISVSVSSIGNAGLSTSALGSGVTAADLALNESKTIDIFGKPSPYKVNQTNKIIDYTLENVAIGAFSITAHKNAWGMVGVGARTFQKTEASTYNNPTPNNNQVLLSIGNAFDPETNTGLSKVYYDLIDDTVTTPRPSNYGQVAIGRYSQAKSNLTSFNTSIGYASLYLADRSAYSTAVGFYSQHFSDKQRNTSLGVWALGVNGAVSSIDPESDITYTGSYSGGNDNVAIGYKSMLYNINSVRADQILSAIRSSGFTDANAIFPNGSQNISIGSNALETVSGSSDTVAIGHFAVTNGGDLTDSVFIGSYVGSAFRTPTGSYYSGSASNLNDWRPTQTVAVGSYAVQNHVGTDIVAVGANALRGVKNPNAGSGGGGGNPKPSNPFSVILAGIPEGLVLGNYEIPPGVTKPWQVAEYKINKSNANNLLDVSIGGLFFQKNCAFQLEDIKILSKSTAYALYLSADVRDSNAGRYPILVKTTTLDKVTNTTQTIKWDTVQHLDSNGKPSRTVKGQLGKASSGNLNVIDEDNIFILSSGETDGIYKSIDGGITFTTALNAKTTFGNYTKLNGLYFRSATNGFVVGNSKEEFAGPPRGNIYPFYAKTTNGGSSWTYDLIDDTASGEGVNIFSVWVDDTSTTAYAGGLYGSIYKTTDGGTSWTKLLGKSKSSGYVDSVYSAIPNYTRATFVITGIYFANTSTGWATVTSAGVAAGASYVLRTTNGGTTWTLSQAFTSVCTDMPGYGVPPLLGVKAVYDPSIANYRVFVNAGYGILYTSTDGGATFEWNRRLPAAIDPNNFNKLTDCVEYVVNTFDVYTEIGNDDQNEDRSSNLASVSQSVAVGADIQVKQDFVENNVAVGYKVQYNASGSAIDSVQIGAKATIEAQFVKDTVAIGKDTLFVTKHSDKTTAVGRNTLRNLLQDASRPQYPVLVVNANFKAKGGEPEIRFTDSTTNTVLGYQAGNSLIMGDGNVFLGANAGMFGNPTIQTYGNNNIMIGTNASKTAYNVINEIGIGNYQNTAAWLWGQYQNAANPWGVMSDGRDKSDTGSFSVGLDFIRNLQPKEFKWDGRFNYASGSTPDGTHKQSGSSYGYIAQDVELAADAAGISGSLFVWNASGSYSGSNDPSGSGNYPLKMLMPGIIDLIAINAIKELDTLVSYISGSKYATNLGNSSDSTFSVTHSLGTRDVIAMVYSNLTEQVVYPTMSIDTINHIQVVFPTPPGTDEYRIVVKR